MSTDGSCARGAAALTSNETRYALERDQIRWRVRALTYRAMPYTLLA
jgi:hypothetical protein